jgi:hypothetical protein
VEFGGELVGIEGHTVGMAFVLARREPRFQRFDVGKVLDQQLQMIAIRVTVVNGCMINEIAKA